MITPEDSKYTLDNKMFIFYKAIEGRHLEILNEYKSPESMNQEELYKFTKFTKFTLDKDEHHYEVMTNFILEVKDLRNILNKKSYKYDRETIAKMKKRLNSYTIYIVVYDEVEDKLVDLHYDYPKFMYGEFGVNTDREK
jgi:hypothetical protein